MSSQYLQQRRFARAVPGYQSYPLSLANGEADVLEQYEGTKRLTEVLDV